MYIKRKAKMKTLMLKIIFILIVSGCATTHRELGFEYRIIVPKKYQWGQSSPALPISPIGKYVSSYEKGWLQCIEKFRENIDLKLEGNEVQYIGSAIHIDGASSGFKDAYKHTKKMIKRYGKDKVKDELLRMLDMK